MVDLYEYEAYSKSFNKSIQELEKIFNDWIEKDKSGTLKEKADIVVEFRTFLVKSLLLSPRTYDLPLLI